MSPEQFAYWLQGFAEMKTDKNPPTREQWELIQEHLATVFKKVTPPLQTTPYPIVNPFQPTNPYQNQILPGQFPPTTIC